MGSTALSNDNWTLKMKTNVRQRSQVRKAPPESPSQKRWRKAAKAVIALNRLKKRERKRRIVRKESAKKIVRFARKYVSSKKKKSKKSGKKSKLARLDDAIVRRAIKRRAKGNFVVRLFANATVCPRSISSFFTGNVTGSSPSCIYRGVVYVGDKKDAYDGNRLRLLGITHVLNATHDIPNFHEADGIAYANVSVADDPSVDLSRHFSKSNKFVHNAIRRGGRILIHCRAGVSRSVTLCLAYLMAKQKMRLRKAYALMRSRRAIVHPNSGFLIQLARYEVRLFKSSSVSRLETPPWSFPGWDLVRAGLPESRGGSGTGTAMWNARSCVVS